MRRVLHTLLCVSLLICGGARADTAAVPALDQAAALAASRAAIGNSIKDHVLLDTAGKPLRLASYQGRPLLVSFIYTGCFRICPATTRNLQKAVAAAQAALGEDSFDVVSIGFNQPADAPEAMRAFAAQQGISAARWHFLSPPRATVAALTRDFGFSYVATPAGFDHILQLSVVDAAGKIHTQIYGDTYSAAELIAPLRQLLGGTPVAERSALAGVVDQVRLFCSVYDPLTGKYRVSYGLVFEIAGGATFILWIFWFFLCEWWTRRQGRRQLGI